MGTTEETSAKPLSTYVAILLAGGALGAGGVSLSPIGAQGAVGNPPEIKVSIPNAISVELPPDQVELMNKVSTGAVLSEITNNNILRLEKKFDKSQDDYRQDLRDRRELDDALRTTLSAFIQDLGLVKRNSEQNSGALVDLEKRLRMLERSSDPGLIRKDN